MATSTAALPRGPILLPNSAVKLSRMVNFQNHLSINLFEQYTLQNHNTRQFRDGAEVQACNYSPSLNTCTLWICQSSQWPKCPKSSPEALKHVDPDSSWPWQNPNRFVCVLFSNVTEICQWKLCYVYYVMLGGRGKNLIILSNYAQQHNWPIWEAFWRDKAPTGHFTIETNWLNWLCVSKGVFHIKWKRRNDKRSQGILTCLPGLQRE